MRLVADVVGQLDLHRPLHQPLGQLGQQAAGPSDLLLRRGASEQLVEQLVADPLIGRHPESLPDPAAVSRPLHSLINELGRERRGVAGGRAAPGLPSANLRSLPLAAIVAGQPRRDPKLEGLKLPAGHQLGSGPALQRCGLGWHDDLFRSCLHTSWDRPLLGAGTRWPDLRGWRGFSWGARRGACGQSFVVCAMWLAASTRSPSRCRTPSWAQSVSDAPGPLRASGAILARRRRAVFSAWSSAGLKLVRTASAGRVVLAVWVSVEIGVSAPRKRIRQPCERRSRPKASRLMSCVSPGAQASRASGPPPRLRVARVRAAGRGSGCWRSAPG